MQAAGIAASRKAVAGWIFEAPLPVYFAEILQKLEARRTNKEIEKSSEQELFLCFISRHIDNAALFPV